MEAKNHPMERGLLRALRAGDEEAWRALYLQVWPALLRQVRGLCGGDPDVVEDVMQETWLVAVRRVGAFDPGRGPFEAWLAGIAKRVHAGLRRRRRPGPAPADPVEPPGPSTHNDVEERVMEVLSSLPERDRAVLKARYKEQRSIAEIARSMGRTEKAVESLLGRAREAFRRRYLRGLGEDAG